MANLTFGEDAAFLQRHTDAFVLHSESAQLIVSPQFQGRVMTSSCAGEAGRSHGWINHALIASGETRAQFNAYGGEDRFWLGPEGGQYSLYFAPGASFTFDHWQTPPLIDTEPFELVAASNTEAKFTRLARLVNYSGTVLDLRIDRTVRLLEQTTASDRLGAPLPEGLSVVMYESVNSITNTGEAAWRKDTGLPSIWILGMYAPSPDTTIVLPYVQHAPGPVVNDAYFGAVPPERLCLQDGTAYFRGDGQQRGKIGLGPQHAKNMLGSYDPTGGVLTLVQYDKPKGAQDYVNSLWEMHEHPYAGDVVNAYNDGPPAPGQPPLGPFYELETSSPAAALAPQETLTHTHRTLHAQGEQGALDHLARHTLGVGLNEIAAALV
jgi:hypothetical protein